MNDSAVRKQRRQKFADVVTLGLIAYIRYGSSEALEASKAEATLRKDYRRLAAYENPDWIHEASTFDNIIFKDDFELWFKLKYDGDES